MSFLEQSISDWKQLGRSLVFLFVCFILLLLLCLGFYFFITGIISKVFSFTDKIEAVETKDGIPTIVLKGKALSVVDVPAQQVGTGSGVKLHKDKKITITTQGLISTGNFMPENVLPVDLQQPSQDISSVSMRMLLLERNRNLNIEWRGLDGNLVNNIGNIGEIPCLYKQSSEMRLDKNSEWGFLVGFIKREDEEVLKILEDEKRIFRIGKKAVIRYDNDRGNYIIETDSNRQDINKVFEDGELFFIINDALVKNENDLDYPSSCNDNDQSEQSRFFEKKLREARKEIFKKMKSNGGNPIGLYYLDNQSSFIVSILTE